MTTTETQAPLARLTAAVRKVHAAGWVWRERCGDGGHRFTRGRLNLAVWPDDEGLQLRVRRRGAAPLTGVVLLECVTDWETLDEQALLAAIAGLS
jgi:hypothetical protein